MPRAKAQHADPLIAALIAKLPTPGTEFPVDRQRAWLKMMATALGVTYGGDVASTMGSCSEISNNSPAPVSRPAAKPAPPSYPFFVDQQNYARRKNGERIMPSDVGDILYDLRGEAGDPGAIIWADESVSGFNGSVSVVM